MVVNRAKFDVCTSSCFGGVKAYLPTDKNALCIHVLDPANGIMTKHDLSGRHCARGFHFFIYKTLEMASNNLRR